MLKTNVYDMNGKQVGEVELSEAVFGIEPNESVVHDVVKNHLANCRQGTQSALTRAEVSGGGKKPWKQKGTGHARQGSTRAPQWTHGGIVFAPKPRDYSYTLNKKVRRFRAGERRSGCLCRLSAPGSSRQNIACAGPYGGAAAVHGGPVRADAHQQSGHAGGGF